MSNSKTPNEGEKLVHVWHSTENGTEQREDLLAVEEPMEIRVVSGPENRRKGKSLSITMRTPGHDEELAAGFLLTEGIVEKHSDILSFEICGPVADGQLHGNIVRVELDPQCEIDTSQFQRHFYTTSSCGVCGKASLDALTRQGLVSVAEDSLRVRASLIRQLPERLRDEQDVFDRTGGLHAAGLFDVEGNLVAVREDVGRHNAMDKLIGQQLLQHALPLSAHLIVVSGRASFELMQKALAAAAPMLIAVGAPSSLAVELAAEFGMTLIGFASTTRFNVYTGDHRVIPE